MKLELKGIIYGLHFSQFFSRKDNIRFEKYLMDKFLIEKDVKFLKKDFKKYEKILMKIGRY